MAEFPHLEVYREVFQVTEWKDDAVYKTKSLGFLWIAKFMEEQNQPRETNIIYAPPPSDYDGPTIRRSKD
jgi:hypothetical protein